MKIPRERKSKGSQLDSNPDFLGEVESTKIKKKNKNVFSENFVRTRVLLKAETS